MNDAATRVYAWQQALWCWVRTRTVPDERGEGVVSLAIGVLIMAFLGAALWVGFKATLSHAANNVDQQVTRIGG